MGFVLSTPREVGWALELTDWVLDWAGDAAHAAATAGHPEERCPAPTRGVHARSRAARALMVRAVSTNTVPARTGPGAASPWSPPRRRRARHGPVGLSGGRPCSVHTAELLTELRTPARGSGSGTSRSPRCSGRRTQPPSAPDAEGTSAHAHGKGTVRRKSRNGENAGRDRPGEGRSSAVRHEPGGTGGLARLPLGSQGLCRSAPSATTVTQR